MIQELLYTSYEGEGLRKGGGGGFCTVLSTQGMATNLASALERLSGYRHPFDIHDPRSQFNPVNYQHSVINLGGIRYRVLSRIADLRREHTGRSNKLAHHIALPDSTDLPICGPSYAMSQPGVCRTDWDNKVTLVPPIPIEKLPKFDIPAGICSVWDSVAKDAGWAGAVADWLLSAGKGAVSIVYPLKTDVLALVNEVFRLIPTEKRWDITFSTYYTGLAPGSTCDLRFVLDGTREAEQLRRDYRQTKIDLVAGVAAPDESPRVRAARTGAPVAATQQTATKAAPVEAREVSATAGLIDACGRSTRAVDPTSAPPWVDPDDDIGVEAPLVTIGSHEDRRRRQTISGRSARSGVPVSSSGSRLPLKLLLGSLAAIILLLFVFAAGAAVVLVAQRIMNPSPEQTPDKRRSEPDTVELATDKHANAPFNPQGNTSDKTSLNSKSDADKKPKADEGGKTGASGSSTSAAMRQEPPPGGVAADKEQAQKTEPEPAATEQQKVAPKLLDPIQDIPPFIKQRASIKENDQSIPKPVQLTDLYDSPRPRNMRIIGLDSLNPGEDDGPESGRLSTEESAPDRSLKVNMYWGTSKQVSGQHINPIAEFYVEDHNLMFKWTDTATSDASLGTPTRLALANGLRFCSLMLDMDGGQAILPLSKPVASRRWKLWPSEISESVTPFPSTLPSEDTWTVGGKLIGGEQTKFKISWIPGERRKGVWRVSFDAQPSEVILLDASCVVSRSPPYGSGIRVAVRFDVLPNARELPGDLNQTLSPDDWPKIQHVDSMTDADLEKWGKLWDRFSKIAKGRSENPTTEENDNEKQIEELQKQKNSTDSGKVDEHLQKRLAACIEKKDGFSKERATWSRWQRIADAERDLFSQLKEHPTEYSLSLEAEYSESDRSFPINILKAQ
jgi:hypothetical protein